MNSNPLHWLIRQAVFKSITIFYRQVEVQGRENLPAHGPLMFVLNHPNGIIDPVLLMSVLDKPIAFLAKSTLFGNPIGKAVMEAFTALPIYRKQDGGENTADRNEATFARCRRLLRQGGAMALFPEGTTHSAPQLLPMKTGAARIALGTEIDAKWQAGLQIVPVGLWYENKALFRTATLIVIGQPFGLMDYAHDPQNPKTVQELTDYIDLRLDGVVLQAENAELLAGIPYIAEWTNPHLTLPQQYAWSAKLLQTYQHLREQHPMEIEQFAQAARQYAKTLARLGISNPWALELAPVHPQYLWQLAVGLWLTTPLFLLGFLLNYLPYRLAAPLATMVVGRDETQISTVKFIGGSMLVLLAWVIEALLCGWFMGAGWGLFLFILAPMLAYITLLWTERWREFYELVSCKWLRWQRQELVQSLIQQRQSLAEQVLGAIQQVK